MCAAEEKGGEAVCTRDAAMWALAIGFTASALLHALLHTPVAGSGGRFFFLYLSLRVAFGHACVCRWYTNK